MKQIEIDGARIKTPEEFYDLLAKNLNLPAHFGRNLDALWDFLTADLDGELHVTWRGKAGKGLAELQKLLADAAQENRQIVFTQRD